MPITQALPGDSVRDESSAVAPRLNAPRGRGGKSAGRRPSSADAQHPAPDYGHHPGDFVRTSSTRGALPASRPSRRLFPGIFGTRNAESASDSLGICQGLLRPRGGSEDSPLGSLRPLWALTERERERERERESASAAGGDDDDTIW